MEAECGRVLLRLTIFGGKIMESEDFAGKSVHKAQKEAGDKWQVRDSRGRQGAKQNPPQGTHQGETDTSSLQVMPQLVRTLYKSNLF